MEIVNIKRRGTAMADCQWTDDEIVAFLDEMLPPERMSDFETQLRDSEDLRRRIAAVSRKRDQGAHSVGDVWRRRQISCPSRVELGEFLLGTLEDNASQYIEFHLRTVGCRFCLANLGDLEDDVRKTGDAPRRRRRFFESSAGYLSRDS